MVRGSSPDTHRGHPPSETDVRPGGPSRPQLAGLPIPIARTGATPRPVQTQYHSSSTTPNTNSPSSSLQSPFPFSPTISNHPNNNGPTGETTTSNSSSNGSIAASADDILSPLGPNMGPSSYLTQVTTPPSSTSPLVHLVHQNGETHAHLIHQLTYPSVPPPSLSSSLGSPVYSRRNSFGQNGGPNAATGRRMSIDRGARVAETGSLVRNRRASAASGGMALASEPVIESPPGTSPTFVVGPGD